MLNTQIKNTITANVATQVDVVAGSIVRDRDERLVKRAPGKPGMPGSELSSLSHSYHGCCFEKSEQHSGSELAARSAIAARQMPAPMWGSLVVLKALSS